MHDNHAFALCRTFGHDWDILQDAEIIDAMATIWSHVFVLRCARCTMQRVDGINAYREQSKKGRYFPGEYVLTGHVDAITNAGEIQPFKLTDLIALASVVGVSSEPSFPRSRRIQAPRSSNSE